MGFSCFIPHFYSKTTYINKKADLTSWYKMIKGAVLLGTAGRRIKEPHLIASEKGTHGARGVEVKRIVICMLLRDVVWVSWGGQMPPPPKKFFAPPPPRIPWRGAKYIEKFSFP